MIHGEGAPAAAGAPLPAEATAHREPPAVALAIAHDLVTKYRLRLTDERDARLGELAGAYLLGAAQWVGQRAAFVGFFEPPDDASEAARDLDERYRAARRWGEQRLGVQGVPRCDILLVALSSLPLGAPAAGEDGPVRVGIARVDGARGACDVLLPTPPNLPTVSELRSHARAVRSGREAPTLAAVDLAERQTVAGGYAQPTTRALRTTPVATYSLIGIFVAIFLLEKVLIRHDPLGNGRSLLDFGALVNWAPRDTEWWRYISSAFLHDDNLFLHVALNSWAIFLIGRLVEQLYGRLVLVAGFIVTAVIGGLAWEGATRLGFVAVPGATIGASGGIAGLMGMLLMLGRVQGKNVPAGVATSIRQWVWLNALFIIAIGFFVARVNNYAHIGGFLGGVLLGLALPPMANVGGRALRRWEQGILAAVIAVAAVALGLAAHNLMMSGQRELPF